MTKLKKVLFPLLLCTLNFSRASTPTILSNNINLDSNGNISVKPEMVQQFNVNNQTGIAEGNRNSRWYSQYRLEVKKSNGKIEKIFEMFPKATMITPAVGKGSVFRDVMITNQNYKNGSLSEILSCMQSDERSTFLLDTIESPIKKVSYDCYMASRPICEKMRDTLRRLKTDNSPKSLKELSAKVKDCTENVLSNSIIALQEIDKAISDSPLFPKMLEESKAELIKKYGNNGYSMDKPAVTFNHGENAIKALLSETGQAFYTLSYYTEICEKFLPGVEGDLSTSDKVKSSTTGK